MREIHVSDIADAVAELAQKASYELEPDMVAALNKARELEKSIVGRGLLLEIVDNYKTAESERIPMCQDTGVSVVFVELGQDVHIVGGSLRDAINQGIAKGYTEGYLRKSMVRDPLFDRTNTGDNTPGVIHIDVVPGDRLRLWFDAKGAGSENMSRLAMLKPADGVQGVKDFVIETVRNAGPNACPPLVVGVGVGGNFETCARLAKHSLLRHVGTPNPDPKLNELEQELLERINRLGVGPMGLGGTVTALAVHIETYPCHIASLPVAVNIECHSHRHKEVVL